MDHFRLNKFASPDDACYKAVAGEIRRLVLQATNQIDPRLSDSYRRDGTQITLYEHNEKLLSYIESLYIQHDKKAQSLTPNRPHMLPPGFEVGDKVEFAIERLKSKDPPTAYYVCDLDINDVNEYVYAITPARNSKEGRWVNRRNITFYKMCYGLLREIITASPLMQSKRFAITLKKRVHNISEANM